MANWLMVTLIGTDQPGIVAKVTERLFQSGCSLGESTMARLGGNFTIMMMVNSPVAASVIQTTLAPLDLDTHIVEISGEIPHHPTPNYNVTVFGADRAGIVADVTHILNRVHFNILELSSSVSGTASKPLYIMEIEGESQHSLEEIEEEFAKLKDTGIELHITAIDTLVG